MIKRQRIRLFIEILEDRYVPTLNPTGLEQEMLEQVNRMRLNPGPELGLFLDTLNPIHSTDPVIDNSVNFFKVNGPVLQSQWSKLVPAPALAWNGNLMTGALGHTNMMIQKDDQSHQFPGEPDLGTRAKNAGYNYSRIGESIFAYGETVFSAHAALAIDWGFTATGIQTPPGHRNNLMDGLYRDIGISIVEEHNDATSVGPLVMTQDFGTPLTPGNPYLLGVVYNDLNKDGRYNNQEGLGNVTVTIDGVKDFQTTSMTAGGYQIQVPAGNYTVTFSGGGIATPIVKSVTVGSQNVKIDAKLTPGGGPNSAPVLDTKTNPVLPTINEDTANPTGATIASLIGSVTTDLDLGALKGAAINGLTGIDQGTWEYSTDLGTTWNGMNDTTAATARMLRDTDKVRFRPNADFNGIATIQMCAWDRTTGTTGETVDLTSQGATGGTTAFSMAIESATITISPVNDAPLGADKTITSLEDKAFALTVADFGFTDPKDTPANGFAQLVVTTLPGKGILTLSGVPVIINQVIPTLDINGGKLVFTPAANANGTPYASFGFRVRDNGGTKNGGIDLDPVANAITIAITSVNDAPTGTNKAIVINEDFSYPLTALDFGFKDTRDTPGNILASVLVSSLPAKGSLTLDGKAVMVNQEISASDIGKGFFQFTPALNTNGASYAGFGFKLRDNGGTENGGIDLGAVANVISFSVTAVNDPPEGTDKTITMLEDTVRKLAVADFGFKDVLDIPANTMASIVVTALPAQGVFNYSGKAVTLNQEILTADIVAGKLAFSPAKNAFGTSYAGFSFKVRDNGGIANGGISLDLAPNTITFAVTPVNDAPLGAGKTVSTAKNISVVLQIADFSFSDLNDNPANSMSGVLIVTPPLKGSLTLNNIAVKPNTFVTAADIMAGKLKFTPIANTTGKPYASFTFRVGDDGGVANGGINFDPIAKTMAFEVI